MKWSTCLLLWLAYTGEAAAQITGLPSDVKIVFESNGPGAVLEDGSLAMKFWWWRLKPGALSITGRRLDGDSPPA